MEKLIWVAYCATCHEELKRCPNGMFAQGAGMSHKRRNEDHEVIVGFEVTLEDLELKEGV